MGKMPFANWKEQASRRPEWIHEGVKMSLRNLWSKNEKPGGWEAGGINIEKTPAEKALALPGRILRPRV
jgi:hypothetical protein